MGVAAIGFAGTTVSLRYRFCYPLYGVKGAWPGSYIIYSIFGLVLYGLLCQFVRRCGAQTLPEYFEMRYNSRVRNVVAYGTIIGNVWILANNIVSLSAIVSGYVGWPTTYFVMGGAFLIVIIFATLSGLWASTITDFIQVTIELLLYSSASHIVDKEIWGIDFIASNWLTGNFMDNE